VYICAFPLQQALADLGIATGSVVGFATMSAALVTPVAFASWYLVERPSLKMKAWTPPSRKALPPMLFKVAASPARSPTSRTMGRACWW
jgi:peptidoglycan/LPS O-acetylase OafA/YrhL